MKFNHAVPCLECAARGLSERVDHGGDAIGSERDGHRVCRGKGDSAGRDHVTPAALALLELAVALPGTGYARLAAGMRQLYPSHAALSMNKPRDASQQLDVGVGPQAEIVRTDAATRFHRSGLGEDQACATDGAAPEVDQMPVGSEPVLAGILAHRRDHDAIRERHAANGQRIEKTVHGLH